MPITAFSAKSAIAFSRWSSLISSKKRSTVSVAPMPAVYRPVARHTLGHAARIGLIGWGTMGSALGAQVADGPLPVELVRIGLRTPSGRGRCRPSGVEAGSVADLLATTAWTRWWADRRDRRAARVVACHLGAGRAYVTGNKALLATHGGELASWRDATAAALLGSASVGGGTPMIETVQHLATAGHQARIRGLLNATTTFILAAMGAGRTYDDALKEAQARRLPSPTPPSTSLVAMPPRRSPSSPRWPGAAGCRSRKSRRAVSSASASSRVTPAPGRRGG